MRRIRLIHWKPEEAVDLAQRITDAGYHCLLEPFTPEQLRGDRETLPHAFVIDLSRLPMQGRDVGVALRSRAATRAIPIIFAAGDPEKVERVRSVLGDAVFCEWAEIAGALQRALSSPAAPMASDSVFAAYKAVPVAQKLGLTAGLRVRLIDPPAHFNLIDLCPDARLVTRGAADLVLWFVRSPQELEAGLTKHARTLPAGGLWILYPKRKAGGHAEPNNLTQFDVRRAANLAGLVDYKIIRLDATWTGLRFARRK